MTTTAAPHVSTLSNVIILEATTSPAQERRESIIANNNGDQQQYQVQVQELDGQSHNNIITIERQILLDGTSLDETKFVSVEFIPESSSSEHHHHENVIQEAIVYTTETGGIETGLVVEGEWIPFGFVQNS